MPAWRRRGEILQRLSGGASAALLARCAVAVVGLAACNVASPPRSTGGVSFDAGSGSRRRDRAGRRRDVELRDRRRHRHERLQVDQHRGVESRRDHALRLVRLERGDAARPRAGPLGRRRRSPGRAGVRPPAAHRSLRDERAHVDERRATPRSSRSSPSAPASSRTPTTTSRSTRRTPTSAASARTRTRGSRPSTRGRRSHRRHEGAGHRRANRHPRREPGAPAVPRPDDLDRPRGGPDARAMVGRLLAGRRRALRRPLAVVARDRLDGERDGPPVLRASGPLAFGKRRGDRVLELGEHDDPPVRPDAERHRRLRRHADAAEGGAAPRARHEARSRDCSRRSPSPAKTPSWRRPTAATRRPATPSSRSA